MLRVTSWMDIPTSRANIYPRLIPAVASSDRLSVMPPWSDSIPRLYVSTALANIVSRWLRG